MDGLQVKDVLAPIATGVVGALAFLLGVYNLYRTIRLERRNELEPYFEAAWPALEEALTVSFLVHSTNAKDAARYAEFGAGHHERIPFTEPTRKIPEMDDLVRRYASQFAKAVNRYASCCAELEKAVRAFNAFLEPVTVEFYLFKTMYDEDSAMLYPQDETEEQRERRREGYRKRHGEAMQLARRYLGTTPGKSLKDLGDDEVYRFHLQLGRARVGERAKAVLDAIKAVEEQIRVFSAMVNKRG